MSGIKAQIKYDKTKPDGSPRRNSDNRKAVEKTGFKAKVPLDVGFVSTIAWYKENFKTKKIKS